MLIQWDKLRQSPQRNKCCFEWEKVVLCDVVSKQKKLSKHLFSPLSHSQPGPLAVLSHFSQHNFGWQQTHITLQNAFSSFFQLCKIYSPAVLSDSIFLPNPNSPSASLLCGFAGSFPCLTGTMQILVRWSLPVLSWCKLATAWGALRTPIASSGLPL